MQNLMDKKYIVLYSDDLYHWRGSGMYHNLIKSKLECIRHFLYSEYSMYRHDIHLKYEDDDYSIDNLIFSIK